VVDDKPNGNNNNKAKNGDPAYHDVDLHEPQIFWWMQPSRKIEDDVQEGSKAIINLSVPSFNSSAPVNGLDNNSDEANTNGEIKYYYSKHNHYVNGVMEDEEKVTEETDKGQYVGDGNWEEKTARLGGYKFFTLIYIVPKFISMLYESFMRDILYIQYRVFFIHSACLVTNSETISSSISFTCTPGLASGISIRSQYSTNDSERLADGCWISSPGDRGGDFFDTKTTSNLRRCKSLPITTWCP
jgi:hypothetical protein